jgi:1-pyrroline-5-carboxylate dehydrogenase
LKQFFFVHFCLSPLSHRCSSSRVAERLAKDLHGRIKIEDAGFDWKILGPDANPSGVDLDYVSWTCDQDAYACSGQKCSAQSMLFAHKNWVKAGLFDNMRDLAARRKLDDLTIGPVLTWTTEQIKAHIDNLLQVPGAKLLFGGKELNGGKHTIPKVYGAMEPTAVFVPLKQLKKPRVFPLATTEVFGPLQVVTEYKTNEIDTVINCCERMTAHLTAAVVSKDEQFRHYVLGRTVNGTTYSGIRARTTGAPQNHWFGPSGDPRGAGIGTKEAIQLVWSSHREIISDIGPVNTEWKTPACT